MIEAKKEDNQLVEVINNNQLNAKLGNELQELFNPLFLEAKEWVEKSKKIVITDDSQVDEMKLARESRLALKDIRCKVETKRKKENCAFSMLD